MAGSNANAIRRMPYHYPSSEAPNVATLTSLRDMFKRMTERKSINFSSFEYVEWHLMKFRHTTSSGHLIFHEPDDAPDSAIIPK
jgi:hypothetical protein